MRAMEVSPGVHPRVRVFLPCIVEPRGPTVESIVMAPYPVKPNHLLPGLLLRGAWVLGVLP